MKNDGRNPKESRNNANAPCLHKWTNKDCGVFDLRLRSKQIKIDVDEKLHGFSPLDIACLFGHVELAKLLLNYEDTKNRKEAAGQSGLHSACSSGQTEMVKFLMEENIPPTPLDG